MKNLLINKLVDAGNTGASVYVIKRDEDLEVVINYPNCQNIFESQGWDVICEIITSDETELDEERAEEIIECYFNDEELEEFEGKYLINFDK